MSNAFTLYSNLQCSEVFYALQAAAHDISLYTDVLIQLIPVRFFQSYLSGLKKHLRKNIDLYAGSCYNYYVGEEL